MIVAEARSFADSIPCTPVTGMEVYSKWPGFLGVIPRPLLAGVLGGLCFLFFTIILSLVTACYMAQRRRLRRKRRQGNTQKLGAKVSIVSNRM